MKSPDKFWVSESYDVPVPVFSYHLEMIELVGLYPKPPNHILTEDRFPLIPGNPRRLIECKFFRFHEHLPTNIVRSCIHEHGWITASHVELCSFQIAHPLVKLWCLAALGFFSQDESQEVPVILGPRQELRTVSSKVMWLTTTTFLGYKEKGLSPLP